MNRFLIAFAIFLVSAHASVGAEDAQSDEKSSIKFSEETGLLLFKAAGNSSVPDAALVETAKSRVTDFCEFQYKAVQISIAEQPAVFFIAQSSTAGAIVFGRHYKVLGTGVTPSTVSCFVTDPGPPGTVGAFITHLLSPFPTEFHVFLSLFHRTPVFVGTSKGVWEVDSGKIRLVQAR